MGAVVYPAPEWHRARARRAAAGRAPRLAITRTIALRESSSGAWSVSIITRRFGVWGKATRLCAPTSFDAARAVAVEAWHQYRLPVARVLYADHKMRPFYVCPFDRTEAQ